jgi:hypothetical protein
MFGDDEKPIFYRMKSRLLVRIGQEHVTEVRKKKGNHWATGFLVGGAVDLVLGGVLSCLAVQSFGSGLSAMGGM